MDPDVRVGEAKEVVDLLEPMPETIRQAWGDEVTADFEMWLTSILQGSRQPLPASPYVQVMPAYARRKVNGLMLDRISYLLLAGEPALIYRDRWYWRVPVDLTFPSRGRVGRVGEIDVDATLGEVEFTDELLDQITQRAAHLTRAVGEPIAAESTPAQ